MNTADQSVNKLTVPDGFRSGLPICLGYLPVAVAFGLLAKSIGLGLGHSLSFSIFVFAGASQFMALNLLKTGAAVGEIIIATLLLNFRHLLMSASLAPRLVARKQWLPLISFGVTDETFAVAATQKLRLTTSYMLALELTAYSGWVIGTGVGFLVGQILPPLVQCSMGIALYAMFIGLLAPQFKKSLQVVVLALGAGAVNTLLNVYRVLPSGWNLVAAMTIAALVGALVFKENEVKGAES